MFFQRKSKLKKNKSDSKHNQKNSLADIEVASKAADMGEHTVILSLYPHNNQENRTVYECMSGFNDLSSLQCRHTFNRVFTEMAQQLCQNYITAVVINNQQKPLLEHIQKYRQTYSASKDDILFVTEPIGIIHIRKGIDAKLLTAFRADRDEDGACESGSFGCIAMPDGFFKNWLPSPFHPKASKDFDEFFQSLSKLRTMITLYSMDCFHNEVHFETDDAFIPQKRVLEIVNHCCELYHMKLIVRKHNSISE